MFLNFFIILGSNVLKSFVILGAIFFLKFIGNYMQYSIQYRQYSTVQYSTVQYSTVQYSTVQYSTVQYSTV